ncbi:hypothetical protein WR25_11976 [Diploscapter pachys]|uniref:Nematode cuticle collagen N-terminal domain-containing protein n=1 Tax=Diploscapter pachys TaxID=2018661 RepID=A0A2A2KWL2_9BILA|nr:hypothetical protein WR25_11976 [Diploscapter pachys]
MSAHTAAFVAVGFSLGALVIVSLYLPAMWSKINFITEDLEKDMLEFRGLHNEVYSRLRYGSNSLANGNAIPIPRKRRQTTPPGECVCDAQNACPPGEKGPPGKPGQDGKAHLVCKATSLPFPWIIRTTVAPALLAQARMDCKAHQVEKDWTATSDPKDLQEFQEIMVALAKLDLKETRDTMESEEVAEFQDHQEKEESPDPLGLWDILEKTANLDWTERSVNPGPMANKANLDSLDLTESEVTMARYCHCPQRTQTYSGSAPVQDHATGSYTSGKAYDTQQPPAPSPPAEEAPISGYGRL